MRRVLRKNTIFRFYLAVLLLCCVGASWFCLAWQARFHARRFDALSLRVVELETRLASRPENPVSSSVEVSAESRVESKIAREFRKFYYVEGRGNNRKYSYVDLVFRDGYRARYYFSRVPSKRELLDLCRRIDHDSIMHYYSSWDDYDEES